MKESTRVRLGLAVMATCIVATGLYGLMRCVQKIVFKEADPAMVIWSEHAGFFWRAWTVTYLGGMCGFLTWLLSERDPARVARLLGHALLVATAVITAQGLLVP